MKISPRTSVGVDVAAFTRLNRPAPVVTEASSTEAAAPRSNDAPSVLHSQVATQARFGTFVQATGNVAAPGADTPASVDDLIARLPEDVQEEVKRFVNGDIAPDYYTPENTAERIANFALSGFARFEGGAAAQEDTAEARRRFVDFIVPAIDQGYGEAIETLGELPDDIRSSLERTRVLIDERLGEFAAQEPVELDA